MPTDIRLAAVDDPSGPAAEPEWLYAQRKLAWQTFAAAPPPLWRRSNWWRTDLSALDLAALAASAPATDDCRDGPPGRLYGDGGEDVGEVAGLLVQHNSRVRQQHLQADLARRGVVFTDLETAVREHPHLVRPHLSSLGGAQDEKLLALHQAVWRGGAFVYVPRGVEVRLPLWAVFALAAPARATFPRSLVVAEAGSRLTYVEQHSSRRGGGQALVSAVAQVHAGPGAWVECITLQDWADDVVHVARRQAETAADSWLRWLTADLGSQITRAELTVALAGAGAAAEVRGLFFADRAQHLDLVATIHHLAPHTASNTLAKGALADQARASFEGLIKIHPGAQASDAYLADHALLLSAQAKSDSVPSLEVAANDVRASHGATVGQIDADQVFYLMSRGLTPDQAEQMIVAGFFEPMVRQVAVPGVVERLQRLLAAKLGG